MLEALINNPDEISEINESQLLLENEEGEREKYIELTPIDNTVGDGSRIMQIALSNPSENMLTSAYSALVITIEDNEVQEPANIFFKSSEYAAEDGSVKVVISREGALNRMVGATLKSVDGTALTELKLNFSTDISFYRGDRLLTDSKETIGTGVITTTDVRTVLRKAARLE